MTELNKSTPANKISPITSKSTLDEFLNYKPDLDLNQGFKSPRSSRPFHNAVDYGSGKGSHVKLGTEILAVQGGTARPVYNWYTNSTTGVKDSAVIISLKDSKGRNVEITYGHLDRKSVEAFFKKHGNINGPVQVNAGEVIGKVGSTGKDGGNEYHVHVDIRHNGKPRFLDPTVYFKQEALAVQQKSLDKSDEQKTVDGMDNLESDINQMQLSAKSLAAQQYLSIAEILDDAKVQRGSSAWNNGVVQIALGTDLEIEQVKDIAKEIPGITPNNAEKLVDGATKNAQVELV